VDVSVTTLAGLRFAVVGAYVTDCFVRTPTLPQWGTEYEVRSVRTSPGGKALNQAVALARLGASVTAVGVVGDDGCGHEVLAALRREGVDVAGVERRVNVSTGVCVCLVSDEGSSAILWHIDDDVAVLPGTIDAAEAISRADAVLLTFEMPPESVRKAIDVASGHGARVVVQPAPPMLSDYGAALSLPWDRVDVLVSNEDEARTLLTVWDVGQPGVLLADGLAQRFGVPKVAVTLGASGCVLHAGGRSRHWLPPDEVAAVDTTGAGDAFAATFVAHLCAGATDEDAAHAAQAAAGQAIQRPGGYESMPTY